MAAQLLLLFSPLLVFCSTQVIGGYEGHWWTHPLDNFGLRPSPYRPPHPWNSPQVTKREDGESEDFDRFNLKKFRPRKRFDEAQIQEALTSDEDEAGTRFEDEAERLRQVVAEDFKLQARLKRTRQAGKARLKAGRQARLKRTEMENLSGAGKEYITRLGKRSWTFHRWANGWQPLKEPQKSWSLWTNPVARHQMQLLKTKGCNEEEMVKKADKI